MGAISDSWSGPGLRAKPTTGRWCHAEQEKDETDLAEEDAGRSDAEGKKMRVKERGMSARLGRSRHRRRRRDGIVVAHLR